MFFPWFDYRVGILGDSLNNYNAYTLSPVGVENEDEENEGEEGEQKQGDNSGANNTDKPTGKTPEHFLCQLIFIKYKVQTFFVSKMLDLGCRHFLATVLSLLISSIVKNIIYYRLLRENTGW